MRKGILGALVAITVALLAAEHGLSGAVSQAPASSPELKLILFGDMAYFEGRGKPDNCILKSRYRHGENAGFRMNVIDPTTAKQAQNVELVVHLTYGGKTEDLPMRYRPNQTNPEAGFWIAKWVVPNTVPTGIVRYTVTAKDKSGRTGEFKPFENELSQLTIVE